MTTHIYALIDPRTKQIRYIGKTCNDLRVRFRGHVSQAKTSGAKRKCRKDYWIRSILRDGLLPEMKIILSCDGNGNAEEIFHISLAKYIGLKLVNGTSGGDGAPLSEAQKRNISTRLAGHKVSAETRLKLSLAMRGKDPPQFAAFRSERRARGWWYTPAQLEALRVRAASSANREKLRRSIKEAYRNKRKPLIGLRFGRWTVIGFSHSKEKQYSNGYSAERLYWKCRCDCGNENSVETRMLVDGLSQSCGCLAKERRAAGRKRASESGRLIYCDPSKWIGCKFGRWTILSGRPNKRRGIRCTCQCQCGTVREVQLDSLKHGRSTSCGCARQENPKWRSGIARSSLRH